MTRRLPAHDEGRRTYRENVDLINKTSPYNPEAPTDGLNDHWEPPPKRDGWWSLLIVFLVVVLAGIAVYSCTARAHMRDRPDLDNWFNSLQGAGGMPCCSQVDGSTVADPDWDTTVIDGKSHYRVRVGGQWIVVTDAEVVEGPNKYGRPLVWVYHIDGKPAVRCFLPGVQG